MVLNNDENNHAVDDDYDNYNDDDDDDNDDKYRISILYYPIIYFRFLNNSSKIALKFYKSNIFCNKNFSIGSQKQV
jgi:hypothetical protein